MSLNKIGNKTLEDVFWWFVRQSRWLCVLLLGFVSWADVANVDITSPSSVLIAARSDWFWLSVITAAALWVAIDVGGRVHTSRIFLNQLDQRANFAIVALGELRKKTRPKARRPDYVNHYGVVFEPLLQAAVLEYRALANVPSDVFIKANLLLLTKTGVVTVVARSAPGSPVPVEYEIVSGMPAATAIETNQTNAVGDVCLVAGDGSRPYRSVAATPLEAGGKVFGAITLDSPEKNMFQKKEDDVDRVLRVYASVVLLAIGDNLEPKDCPNRYGH